MKTKCFNVGTAFSFAMAAALFPACGGGDIHDLDVETETAFQEDDPYSDEGVVSEDPGLGTLDQNLQNCSNPDGTNSVMAALAVAAGQDLRRWQATLDFEVYNTGAQYENQWGWQQAIRLTSGTGPDGKPRGKSRCYDGQCARVQALLAMQYENSRNQVWVQGESSTNRVLVDPGALRSRMVAKLREQKVCDDNARDGDARMCPREQHTLSAIGTANLGGCGQHYTFATSKDPSGALSFPNQLKMELTFADQTNGWVDFRNLGNGQVAIDPTVGLNEGVSTSAGTCMSACTRVSRSNVSGQCCSCGGSVKRWTKSTFSSYVYACR